ncbi:MAG: hypothetical protein IIC40_03655, partial [Candidatus Marinimicrobia bacterium]|nr:hypothetical protein [Candidatus Neomarinimicrobiota bacterium]
MADKSSNRTDLAIRYGTLIVLLISSLFFFPREKSLEYAYEVGQITTDEIIAPFDFPILKTKVELEKDRQKALEQTYPLFERRDDIMLSQLDEINKFFDILRKVREAKAAYGKNLTTKVLRAAEIDSAFLAELKEDSLNFVNLVNLVQREYNFNLSRPKWRFLTDRDNRLTGG